MKKVEGKITVIELSEMAGKMYGNLVKGVVDLERGVLVVDAEMHADEEQFLLENNSQQRDLWGINLYPAMINIRPRQQNMSRGVEDEGLRRRIIALVSEKVQA